MAIKRWPNLWNTVREHWYLGFTSFGGPPVHFKIVSLLDFILAAFSRVQSLKLLSYMFHDKFTDKLSWVDENVYQEIFSVCQALSGPASTKMLYCINLLHDGFLAAVLSFLFWSLPGALGMYGLSIGVSSMGESLPGAVYALLSGINAATVGIIGLAAVQLSKNAITDKMTRVLVFLGAAAGMMYNALWYFPLLMVLAGVATVTHDFRWLHGPIKIVANFLRRRRRQGAVEEGAVEEEAVEMSRRTKVARAFGLPPHTDNDATRATRQEGFPDSRREPLATEDETRVVPEERQLNMSWKVGLLIIVVFFVSFIVVMVLRAALPSKPLLYSLFANLYLAGTIIFGGGPVVIPLLREYVVAENWVSPRDFLIGLALIQAFPGPNFNFATYLGALTAINAGYSSIAGAVIGFVGIFAPGLILVHGTMGVWAAVRGWRWVKSALRGVNAAAVGLVYTAVYRLWRIGYIDKDVQNGTDLGVEPWWVVVTATSYVGGFWFGIKPPVAIIMGAVMGLIWYGVVSN